ncbi:MAG: hypothetical protein JNN27_20870 [Planctomycetes bacterium]|nr:hypothetical protein [Planctomycetota bacterium]
MSATERRPEADPAGSCRRPDLAICLPDWDQLEAATQRELVAHAQACPVCAPKWRLIQATDAFLAAGAASGGVAAHAPALACPTADELYDLGRGPGARSLSEVERVALGAHVNACADCAALIATLRERPPAPLEFESERREFAAERRRRMRVWMPLAAAAALLAVFLWDGGSEAARRGADVGSIRFPRSEQLRGEAAGALLFPRERLLASAGGLHSPLHFELAPRERATRYRVQLERHDGQLFSAAEPFLSLESESASFDAAAAARLDLVPGHYTWEAWAFVDGLDVPLGRRDFEVVRDEELIARIAERERASEPARSESILHLLEDSGFACDARAFARTLPASPARDAYLARRPER